MASSNAENVYSHLDYMLRTNGHSDMNYSVSKLDIVDRNVDIRGLYNQLHASVSSLTGWVRPLALTSKITVARPHKISRTRTKISLFYVFFINSFRKL